MPTPVYRPAPSLLGLCAEPDHLTAVVMARRSGFWRARGAARETLPAGAVHNGRVVDFEAVCACLVALRQRLGQRDDQAALALPAALTTTRRLQVPAGSAATLRALVELEAPRHLDLPLDSVYLDFIAGAADNTPAGRCTVTLVAAARSDVDPWLEACRTVGLKPRVVDLDSHGLIRALCWSQPDALPGQGQDLTALIVTGPDRVSVLIVSGQRLALHQTEPLTAGTDPIDTVCTLTHNSLQAFPTASGQTALRQLLLIGPFPEAGQLSARLAGLAGQPPRQVKRPRSLPGRPRHPAVPADFASFAATGLALWRSRP